MVTGLLQSLLWFLHATPSYTVESLPGFQIYLLDIPLIREACKSNTYMLQVIQNRGDYGEPKVNFTASWQEYKAGFGELQVESFRTLWGGVSNS